MKENKDLFSDIISPLLEGAIIMHEMYLNFIEAGFSKEEAIILVGNLMTNMTEKLED